MIKQSLKRHVEFDIPMIRRNIDDQDTVGHKILELMSEI
jgi:hypothetical protein